MADGGKRRAAIAGPTPNDSQSIADNSAAQGIRELALSGFDPVPIVALWRPEDSRRVQEPLRLLHG